MSAQSTDTGVRPQEVAGHQPQRKLARLTAALIGTISVGAALALGGLIAAFLNPQSSPLLAVGSLAVNQTPGFLKEFAVSNFGDYDKIVLLCGMGVVIFLVAVAAGLISRSRPEPGVIAAVLIGAIGVVAVYASPVFAPLDLLAPVVSLIAGALTFRLLHRLAWDMPVGPTVLDHGVLFAGVLGVFLIEVTQTLISQPNMSASLARLLIIVGVIVAVLALIYVLVRVFTGTGRPAKESSTSDSAAPVTEPAASVSGRRPFLLASAGAAAGAAVVGFGGYVLPGSGGGLASRQALIGKIKPSVPAPPIPAGADFVKSGTPSFLTPNEKFYRVDTALVVPQLNVNDWRLRIHGMVDKELSFSFKDLLGRRLVERTVTLTCVSNEVGGRYISTANFVGVPMRELLMEAGVHESSDELLSTSSDGWSAGTPVDVLLDEERGAMLAIAMNGEPLPLEHGFPARMVTPGLYGYLSATKWIVDMELTTFDAKQGYWVPKGYSLKAPIKTESRIDKPKAFEQVPAGKTTIAGIAWGQPKGIKKVQVRVDDGQWQDAELAAYVNGSTWRMWRAVVDVQGSGSHSVECRATDGSGYTQTDKDVSPLPNGASGWHSVSFQSA